MNAIPKGYWLLEFSHMAYPKANKSDPNARLVWMREWVSRQVSWLLIRESEANLDLEEREVTFIKCSPID